MDMYFDFNNTSSSDSSYDIQNARMGRRRRRRTRNDR